MRLFAVVEKNVGARVWVFKGIALSTSSRFTEWLWLKNTSVGVCRKSIQVNTPVGVCR